MPASPPTYTKLPGRGLRRSVFAVSATRCRLWLAVDHLLAVDYTIASEEYRRFYFRDIEALIIRRTAHRQVWNWILLFFLLATAVPFFIAWRFAGHGGLLIASLSFAAFWLLFIIINSARGATCQTHIRTAVQNEQLPSLSRLSAARKVLARIQPLIVAVQGEATPEELGAAPWMAADGALGPGDKGPKAIRTEKGWLHGSLFGLLLLETILTVVAFLFFQEAISLLSMLAMFGGCIVCVFALMRQSDTDLPALVRHVTKCALGYYILKCVAGYVFMMMFVIQNPKTPLVTGLEIAGAQGFTEASLISVGLGAIIGLIGLFPLLAHLRQRSAALAA
jgi:hypothetical protein